MKCLLISLILLMVTINGYSLDNKSSSGKKGNKQVPAISTRLDTMEDIINRSDEKNIRDAQMKSTAKTFKPIPEEVFTKLRIVVDFGFHVTKMGNFGKALKDYGYNKPEGFAIMNASLIWQFTEMFGGGLKFGGGANKLDCKKPDTTANSKHIDLLDINYVNVGLVFSFIPVMTDDWVLDLQLSGGFLLFNLSHEKIVDYVDTSVQDSYTQRNYNGSTFFLDAGLIFSYRLNKVWALGLGGGIIFANVKQLKDEIGDNILNTSTFDKKINLTGGYFKIQTQFGF